MPVRLVRPDRAAPPPALNPATYRTCTLVNNMPDSAFATTEAHFVGLLEAASGRTLIDVRRTTMDGIARSGEAAGRIAAHYFPMGALFRDPPDLLIVTGSNPVQAHIEDEPYWDDMVDLINFAPGRIPKVMLSCLSAHAALGGRRRPQT